MYVKSRRKEGMSTFKVLDTLLDIRWWLRDQDKWVQGSFAADDKGIAVKMDSPHVYKVCISGAAYLKAGITDPDRVIDRAQFTHYSLVMEELNRSQRELHPGYDDIVSLNDNTDHATVLRVLDHAITRVAAPLFEEAQGDYLRRCWLNILINDTYAPVNNEQEVLTHA
jgi:hypothetical protein